MRFREEGTRSMEVVEPEVERGFLEIAEKGAELEVGIVLRCRVKAYPQEDMEVLDPRR